MCLTSNVKLGHYTKLFDPSRIHKGIVNLHYGSIWVAIFNLKCNMQNEIVICNM